MEKKIFFAFLFVYFSLSVSLKKIKYAEKGLCTSA